MNPDAELDAAVRLLAGITLDHAALDLDGAAECCHHARELNQDSIARGLNHTTFVLGDLGFDQLVAVSFQARQGAFLVAPDQPAIPRDTRGPNPPPLSLCTPS